MPLCWQFSSLKNRYLVVCAVSSALTFVWTNDAAADDDGDGAVAEVPAAAQSSDLNTETGSLDIFSAISEAMFVSCGPTNM